MLIVIAGFPSAFVGILFTGALLTEIIFSLDGLGLLMGLIGDLMYTVIDPRITFERVGA